MPFLSIIVPCFNAETYLNECIHSVISQDSGDWELILINDGSTDATQDICQKFVAGDNRIILYTQQNAGVSKARNVGLRIATGDYVTFLDADDWLTTDFISSFKRTMSADMILCGYREILPTGKIKSEWRPQSLYTKKPLNIYTVRNSSFRTPWAVLLRRDLINTHIVGFNECLSWGEDSIFMLDYLMIANDICFMDKVCYNYRYTQQGLTNSGNRPQRMLDFLYVYLNKRKSVQERSELAADMMNELIIFLLVILFSEALNLKNTILLKYVIGKIHFLIKQLPVIFILKTKVGRMRYVVLFCAYSMNLLSSIKIYKCLKKCHFFQ